MIGRELHPDPTDPDKDEHFHTYSLFGSRVMVKRWRICKLFDLTGREGRVLHPQIQKVGTTIADRVRVIRYDMKDGDFISRLLTQLPESEPESDSEESEGRGRPRWAAQLNGVHSVREGMQMLAEQHPHMFYLHGARIAPMLQQRVAATGRQLSSL